MSFKRQTLIFGPIAALCVAASWSFAIHFKPIILRARSTTLAFIHDNDALVQSHVREYGDTPQSLNELRLYAQKKGLHYNAFDAWGERLEYLRLGKVNYTIRSFGADGVQNRPGEAADPGVFRWGPMVEHGLQYNERDGATYARPSVVLFAGADESQGKWHAKLFVDPVSGIRRLLVRSRERTNFYMLAPHDGVEEFLWLPGQQKIIFTASQSERYSDGVYVWDLHKDESFNLFALDPDGSDIDPGTKQRRLYLALSSVRVSNPPSLAVFAEPVDQLMLDPKKFFHPRNLHVFTLGEQIVHLRPAAAAAKQKTLHDMSFLGMTTVAEGGEGSPLQKAWLRLPLGGDWEKGVIAWQDFASLYGKTQLAPYAVWGLTMFYQEAAKQAGYNSRNGQIFMGYSGELCRALSNMVVAPGYLRAIGAWMGEQP